MFELDLRKKIDSLKYQLLTIIESRDGHSEWLKTTEGFSDVMQIQKH